MLYICYIFFILVSVLQSFVSFLHHKITLLFHMASAKIQIYSHGFHRCYEFEYRWSKFTLIEESCVLDQVAELWFYVQGIHKRMVRF
jgi:hypothetical protein